MKEPQDRLSRTFLELSLIKLLYVAVKNPYNGLSDDEDYRLVLKNMLRLSKQMNINLGFNDEDNIIHHDINLLIKDILNEKIEVSNERQ